MRYLDWDVLIFPENHRTPLQEFQTQCGVIEDPHNISGNSRPIDVYTSPDAEIMPLITAYVPSLPEGSVFRVSVHTWTPPEPSQAARALMGPQDTIEYRARVYIDEQLSSENIFDNRVSFPRVIDTSIELNMEGEPDTLKFPPFHQDMTAPGMRNPADSHGRIRVILTETVVHAHTVPTHERVKDLVGFSFQHGPLNILEGAGIAWPNASMWQPAPRRRIPLAPLVPFMVGHFDHEAHAHSQARDRAMADATAHQEFERAVTHIDQAPLDSYARNLQGPPAFHLARTRTVDQSVDMGDADLDPFVDHSDGTFARRLGIRSDVSMHDASNAASTRVSSRNPSNQSRMSIASQGIAPPLGAMQTALYESVIDAFGGHHDLMDTNTLEDQTIMPEQLMLSEGTTAQQAAPTLPMGRKLSTAAAARQAAYAHATRVTSMTNTVVPFTLSDIDTETYQALAEHWADHREDLLERNEDITHGRDGVDDTLMNQIWVRYGEYEDMVRPGGDPLRPRDAAFDDVIIKAIRQKREKEDLEARNRQLASGQIMGRKEGNKRAADTLEDGQGLQKRRTGSGGFGLDQRRISSGGFGGLSLEQRRARSGGLGLEQRRTSSGGIGLEQQRVSSGGLSLSTNRLVSSLSRNTTDTLGVRGDVKRKGLDEGNRKEPEADRGTDRKENNDFSNVYSSVKRRFGIRPKPRVRVSETGSPGSLLDEFDEPGVEAPSRELFEPIPGPEDGTGMIE